MTVLAVITVDLARAQFATTSSLAAAGIVGTLFCSLYPRVLVSHPTFANSLTVANASSSHYSLSVISVAALILLPAVLVYQGWTYHVFRRRVMGRADDATDTGLLPTGAG